MAAEHVERIGRRLRERRKQLGLSQGDVARALPGKVDANQVSRWERGLHRPTDDTLELIARVLDVEFGYFMGDGPSRSASQPPGDRFERVERMLEAVIDHFGIGLPDEALDRDLEAEARQPGEPNAAGGRTGRARGDHG